MMMNNETKREVKRTSQFKKDYKNSKRQGKNIELLLEVIEKLPMTSPCRKNIKTTP
jgi:mRNA-degrading endonuclease YafQ of YafQ-DinJ toxin-antitoxin module